MQYEYFLEQCEDKSAHFQTETIDPSVASINALGDIFQYDMDNVLFDGLEAAMHEILTVYGPSRDTIYFFLDRVILNSKEVSLHLKSLLLHDHLADNLKDLVNITRFYAEEVIETLPTYYKTVSDTSATLEGIDWETHNLSFLPKNLAKKTEKCNQELELFVNLTWNIDFFLEEVLHDMELYSQGHRELNLKRILRDLYLKISEYEDHYVYFKTECLEQFINSVNKLVEFNDTYHEVLKVHTHLEYVFDFEEESLSVKNDYLLLKEKTEAYLTHANTTKVAVQYNLTDLLTSDMIARASELLTKIKFRLIERFREQLDVIRLDFTDWYTIVQHRAIEFQEYVSDHYMEYRARDMRLWRSPTAITPDDHEHKRINGKPFYYKDTPLSQNWTTAEFLHEVSLKATHDIIEDFLKPINGVLNHYEEILSHFERELDTSLKELQAWMRYLRSEDENSQKFVL